MVFVKTEWGGFHEPPYTIDEQLEFARRMKGVVAFKSHQHRQPPRPPQDRKDGQTQSFK
jgi:hypothetical protein